MKPSFHRPSILVSGLALLIAAFGMLVSTPGAQAAGHRGAVLVKDINPGRSPSITTNGGGNCGCIYNGGDLTDVHGTLYFSANDGKHGFELWRSDGTGRGTRMVKDINPGRGGSDLTGITAVNRIIYFTADDGTHGAELWRSDGTTRGTRMVKDINPGPASGGPGQLTDLNGTLYFTASEGNHVSKLWRSDGTEAGTTVVKSVSAGDLTDFHGALYFAGPGGLWRSDGTEAGTTVVKDNIGIGDELIGVNGILYFAGFGRAVAKRRHRGRHDHGQGLRAGELPLPPTDDSDEPLLHNVPRTRSHPESAVAKRWHRGRHHPCQAGPARRPHRRQGEVRLLQWRGRTVAKRRHPAGNDPGQGKPLRLLGPPVTDCRQSTLYLVGSDKRHGQELWRSNGTRAGTTIVRDIRRGSSSSEPTNLTAVGGTLFFTAKDGRHNRELWRAGPPPCAKGKCKKG